MSYEVALSKAWEALLEVSPSGTHVVRFLSDEYGIKPADRTVTLLSTMQPAADFTGILLLHYLVAKLRGIPPSENEWLTFRELSDVEGYLEAFKKRAIAPLVKKFGAEPEKLHAVLRKMPARIEEGADSGIIIEAFEGVAALIKVWGADEEFGPDANMYFDRSIKAIFCTEDIVVLAGIIAHSI